MFGPLLTVGQTRRALQASEVGETEKRRYQSPYRCNLLEFCKNVASLNSLVVRKATASQELTCEPCAEKSPRWDSLHYYT